jgi:hypothetical protein
MYSKFIFVTVLVFILIGCGGGGGEETSTNTNNPQPPTVQQKINTNNVELGPVQGANVAISTLDGQQFLYSTVTGQ